MLGVVNCEDCTHVLKKKEIGLLITWTQMICGPCCFCCCGLCTQNQGSCIQNQALPSFLCQSIGQPCTLHIQHFHNSAITTNPTFAIYQYKRIISPSMLSLPLTSACNVRPLCDDGTVTWIESISVCFWLKLALVKIFRWQMVDS